MASGTRHASYVSDNFFIPSAYDGGSTQVYASISTFVISIFFFPIWNQTASEIFPLYCPALTTRKSKFMFFIQSSIPFQFTCLLLIPFFFKATIAKDTFVLHSLFTSNQFPGPVHFLLKYLIYLSISFILSLYQPQVLALNAPVT